jgi:DNA-binding transcriptional LysR family regulator
MNINYEYYRTFYYAAKYSNFTKAANVLCSNQPNVTRNMNKLEQELGCKLFLRTKRKITLTPEGERLFAHVEIAQEQLQAGEEELTDSTGLQSGTVVIGASETALNLFLLERLRQFHERFPGVRLRILNHSTPQAVAALKQGMVDLAVVTTPVNTEKPLQETRVMPFREILVGGSNFASLSEKPLRMKELAHYQIIMLGRETMTYALYNRLFMQYGLVLQPDTEAATADQLLPLVKCNLGLAFVPEQFAQDALEKGEVFQIPLVEAIPQRQVMLIRDRHKPLSVAAREFEKSLLPTENAAGDGSPDRL